MKNFIRIGLLLCLCVVCGSAEELPNDVQLLVSKRNAEIAKIDHAFVVALEKLKDKYTKAGNLESANATVVLIDKYKVKPSLEPIMPDLPIKIFGKSYSWIVNGKNANNILVIFERGGGTFGGKAITWTKTGENRVRLLFNNRITTEITWSPDCKSLSGTEGDRKVVGHLIE